MSKNKGWGNDHFCKVYYNNLIKMRRIKSLVFIFISSIFLGCSNSQETKLSYTDVDTIKEIVKEREIDVSWTKEIEGGRLTTEINKEPKLSDEVPISPNTIKILPGYKNSVYPSLQNFGSLDIQNLPVEKREALNNLCKAVSENIYTGPESYFKSNYVFNYVFFKNDLIEKWPIMFEEDFPVTKEDFDKAKEAAQKKADEIEKENKKKGITEEVKVEPENPEPIFSKWILGEPFIDDNLIQIPVRFFSKNGSVDVTILMVSKGENAVYQMLIDRWEKSNGREE